MIIGNNFVLLNFPKTGSTFVRNCMHEIELPKSSWVKQFLHKQGAIRSCCKQYKCKKIFELNHYGIKDQHGVYIQIPEKHRHKKIVSVARNPFSRMVSAYNYGWWRRFPPAPVEEIKKDFPAFPELSFHEYRKMGKQYGAKNRLAYTPSELDIGPLSIQFLQFYAKDPAYTLANLTEEKIFSGAYKEELADVRFLFQENLRNDLCQWLLEEGYSEEELKVVREKERVNVSTSGAKDAFWDYFDRELVEEILQKERLYFNFFPHYREGIERFGL